MVILQKSRATFLVTPTANFIASCNVFLIRFPTLSLNRVQLSVMFLLVRQPEHGRGQGYSI